MPNTATTPPRSGWWTSAPTEYYGQGYQDVENRVPKIDNTRADLDWAPRVTMQEALRQIFEAYRGEIAQGRSAARAGAAAAGARRAGRRMQLALKIDVDTLRGTREGVPALIDLLRRRTAPTPPSCSAWGPTTRAGPCAACSGRDSSARWRAPRCSSTTASRRCCMARCCRVRISVARRRRFMRRVRDAGFEVGIHCFDHTNWQDFVSRRDAAWTRTQMLRAVERFREVFGSAPRCTAPPAGR